MEEPVAFGRNEVFLGQELDGIGQQSIHQSKTGKSQHGGTIGTDAVLNECTAFSLDPPHDTRQVQHHEHNQSNFGCYDNKIHHG